MIGDEVLQVPAIVQQFLIAQPFDERIDYAAIVAFFD
jgi:hypothetical protein